MSKRALKAEQWRQEVERWRGSGQTRAAYCAERGLSVQSLGQWVRRLGDPAAGTASTLSWVLARPIDSSPSLSPDGALCVHSPLGWRLQFAQLPPASWLAQLLAEGSPR